METITLTKIYTTNKDKAGNQLMSKNNKPYTRMSIKCSEHGDKLISGFQNQQNQNWKEGDKVEVIIKENGQYLNFETPKKDDRVIEMLSEILTKIGTMNAKMDVIYGIIKPETKKVIDTNYPDIDIKLEDMPY